MAEIHSDFRINGLSYVQFLDTDTGNDRLAEFKIEITKYLNNEFFNFQTSGTTGSPKELKFSSQQIIASAKLTQSAFGLDNRSVVLHVLPLQYVAGKMMLYRALILGYHLWALDPKISSIDIDSVPLNIDFVPMVPLQVSKLLDKAPITIKRIKNVLIGGAPISRKLRSQILDLDSTTKFYESYGSTETLTHVALRNVKSNNKNFKAIGEVEFSEHDGCLGISAPHISNGVIITNDKVDLISKSEFKWLGRKDNVINSGGIKIQPELIEDKLSAVLKIDFFIAGIPSTELGEQVVLVVEGEGIPELNWRDLGLSIYEIPKKSIVLHQFIRTDSGKISRDRTLELI